MKAHIRLFVFPGLLATTVFSFAQPSRLGIFSDQRDIGSVAKPGSASFDAAKGEYLVAGGGATSAGFAVRVKE